MGGTGRRRWTAALAAAGVAAALAVAGCTSTSSDGSAARGDAPAPAAGAPGEDAGAGAPPAEGGAGDPGQQQAGTAVDLRVDQRAIIYTGSITVRLKDLRVDEAAARATAIVTGAGGFVGADKRDSGDGGEQASLELRVPADRFGAVVDQLAGLGDQEQRSIDTQDVTEETVDLDARITTQRARVASGRRLLAQAKSLSDLVMLEGEVAKREADLASLEAKKRRLTDLTALSTITAVFLDPQAAPPADEPDGFLSGLAAGWTALLASLRVLLTVLGALLPWVLALGLPVVAVLWLLRRSRRRRSPTAAQGPAPASAPAAAPAATD